MAMQNTFSHLFYIKKSKIDKGNKCVIYCRITVNGRRSEFSIQRKVDVDKWNQKANRVKGYSKIAQEVNAYIDLLISKINKVHGEYLEKESSYSAVQIRDGVLGVNLNQKRLLELFEEHNSQMKKLVGKDYSPGTLMRYKTSKSHVRDFIRYEYNLEEILLDEVDHRFISRFEYYLKTKKECSHNTAVKYVTNLRKIIRIAYANDWISKDPFYNWKSRLKKVEREFLSENEINAIVQKEFPIKRLDLVRDIFVFSCFTGLAYADVQRLNKENLVIGIDGNRWIHTKRKKTNTVTNIPLLPEAERILNKYKNHPKSLFKDQLLPILSNQKMNAYLKEIADVCEINKNLTFHLARHTFATTVTLTNGVPIESVSKMLGHSSIKTTQHYAKILDKKVSIDMRKLRNMYSDSGLNSNIEQSN